MDSRINSAETALVTQVVEVALARGVIQSSDKENTNNAISIDHARFTLWPSRFPRIHYNCLLQIQKDFNLLLDKMSQDKSFLLESLSQ